MSGFKDLLVYQLAVIIYDLTYEFVKRYIPYKSRTQDQMEQAVRSGKQNIVEGSTTKSLKTYIYLISVARASMEELLEDYKDYLRTHSLPIWDKNDPRALEIRRIRINPNVSNSPNLPNWTNEALASSTNWTTTPECFANLMITLISLDCYLLDKLAASLEKKFINEGGFTENLFKKRMERRSNKPN